MMITNLPSNLSPEEMLLDYDVFETAYSEDTWGGWIGIIYDCKSGATVWCSGLFRSPGMASLETDKKLSQIEANQNCHFKSIEF